MCVQVVSNQFAQGPPELCHSILPHRRMSAHTPHTVCTGTRRCCMHHFDVNRCMKMCVSPDPTPTGIDCRRCTDDHPLPHFLCPWTALCELKRTEILHPYTRLTLYSMGGTHVTLP
eukprot:940759_1